MVGANKMIKRHRARRATIMTQRLSGKCGCGLQDSMCDWERCVHRWIASLNTKPKLSALTAIGNSTRSERKAELLRKLYLERRNAINLTALYDIQNRALNARHSFV